MYELIFDIIGFDCMFWVFIGWKVYICNEFKCIICKVDDCIYQIYLICFYKFKIMFDVLIMDGNLIKNFFLFIMF